MKQKVITDYDSDWSPAFRAFDSEQFLDSDSKQAAAHSLAFVLFELKQLAQQKKIDELLELIEEGLQEIFEHTDVYHLTRKLFFDYLAGNVNIEQEPLAVLSQALKK